PDTAGGRFQQSSKAEGCGGEGCHVGVRCYQRKLSIVPHGWFGQRGGGERLRPAFDFRLWALGRLGALPPLRPGWSSGCIDGTCTELSQMPRCHVAATDKAKSRKSKVGSRGESPLLAPNPPNDLCR